MTKKKKPAPPSMKLSKRPPVRTPSDAPVAKGINDVSPITDAQIKRAERAIDNLRQDVKDLRKAPPQINVTADAPQVVIPPRPRISRVKIKYDQLGFPSELVPEYTEA